MSKPMLETIWTPPVRFEMVPIEKLSSAPFQPEMRLKENDNLKDLRKSISEMGILRPLAVTADYEIGDGHRRLWCARELGLTHVPCQVYEGLTLADLFGHLNIQRSLSPAEQAIAWCGSDGAMVVDRRVRRNIQHIIDHCGAEGMDALAAHGASPSIWSEVRAIARYTGKLQDRRFLRMAFYYLLTSKVRNQMRRALEAGTPPEIIVSAVRKGKNLKPVYYMEEQDAEEQDAEEQE